jgi:MFS family permease
MLIVALGAAGAILVMAAAQQALLAAGALAMMTVCTSTMVGLANTTVQERTPNHLRGRVSAIAGMSFFGLMPFAGLGISALSDGIGLRPAMATAAVIFAIGAAYGLMGPARRASEPTRETPVVAELS